MDKPSEGKSISPGKGKFIVFDKLHIVSPIDELEDTLYSFDATYLPPPNEKEVHHEMPCHFSCCQDNLTLEDPELFESFLNHPLLAAMANSITIQNIQQHQLQDLSLNNSCCQYPQQFPIKMIENRPLICWRSNINDLEGW
eukprot:442139-Ditylum_brightwellii.AAC.1